MNKNMKSGFWQGCHPWTNPGAGFQRIQFQPQNKSRIWSQLVYCCTMWQLQKKNVTDNWALESHFKLNCQQIFINFKIEKCGHCQWNKLGAKMSRNFLSNRFSILLQFSKGDFHIGSITYWDENNRLVQPSFYFCFWNLHFFLPAMGIA